MNLRIPRVSIFTLKLISKPSFVHRLDRRNGLELDHDVVDKKIHAISTVNLGALVRDGKRHLPQVRDLAERQFARETFLISRSEQPRAKFAMNFNSRANDFSSDVSVASVRSVVITRGSRATPRGRT